MTTKINKSQVIAQLRENEGMTPEKIDDLLENLHRNTIAVELVEKKLDNYLSKRYQIKLGFVRASSTALGATIGIAIVLVILQWMVKYLGEIPIIDEIIRIIIDNIPENCV
jgi:hypothetical protein